ncbi:uncharacterized protein LOC134935979 isoform X2 [Pseudophryne corroboree]|uniref:uncharacterized protein LOC134935979 isoform X2 n=1 Tax=Pseudophryne corroboree TaxID=495146 RepID=UPI003081282C
MEAAKLLLLFFSIQGGAYCDPGNAYCTEQPGVIMVEEGGSVTLPCTFTYPEDWDSSTEVKVYWRQGNTSPCGNVDFIYNHTEGWTHRDYRGQISLVGNPQEQRTATIRIQNLKKTDGPMFCCRVRIENKGRNGDKLKEWQNPPGTYIYFRDKISVEQTDVVPATLGEDVVIPCKVHNKPDDIRAVTWRMGTSILCSNNSFINSWMEDNKMEEFGRWSVVNFPEDLSLHIRDVTSSDSYRYCCEVRTRLREPIRGSARGTDLVLTESNFEHDVKAQWPEPSGETKDSVTLNCSYSLPPDKKPLWIGIYWRVGNTSDVYAYHPSTEMVHPRYRGRTELRGLADLHIMGVQETDSATYYCFVVLKFCDGLNNISSVIQYGSRTTLDTTMDPLDQVTLIIIIAAVLLILIILCFIFIVLKKKGIICRKESELEDRTYITSDVAAKPTSDSKTMEMPNVETNPIPTGQEESGGVLYAHLNVTSLQPGTANRSGDDNVDSQVLYAAVRRAH